VQIATSREGAEFGCRAVSSLRVFAPFA